MNFIEEAAHIRIVFKQAPPDWIAPLIVRIRDEFAIPRDAKKLVEACAYALECLAENDVLPERASEWICHEYAALDSPAVDAAKRQAAAQSARAQKPRGKGDDGRTIRDLIQSVANSATKATKPSELWPAFVAAVDEWAGGHFEKTRNGHEVIEYEFSGRRKTISYKQFRERLGKIRNAV